MVLRRLPDRACDRPADVRPAFRYALLYVLSMGLMYALCHQPPVKHPAPTFEKLYAKPWPKTWEC